MLNEDNIFDNSHKKAVIQLADYGGSYSGNFVASLLELGNILKKNGLCQVLIFSEVARDKAWINDLREKNVPMYFLPKKKSILYIAVKIIHIALKEKAIILHTHFTTYDIAASIAQFILKIKNKKIGLVWHIHSNFPIKQSILRRLKDLLKFKIFGRSVQIISVSEEINRSLSQRGFHGHVNVILNGIDISRATMSQKTKLEMRFILNIPTNALVLLVFGWEPITKGIDLLIEAAQDFSQDSRLVLVIIGEKKLYNFVRQRFQDDLPDWLKVMEPVECVSDLFRASDVFISASRWEGCPYSVMEAMANGLPIISSDICGMDWAKNTNSVKFFDSEDSEGLIQAIKQIIGMESQELRSIAAANIELINTNYSVSTWASNIYAIYRKIL